MPYLPTIHRLGSFTGTRPPQALPTVTVTRSPGVTSGLHTLWSLNCGHHTSNSHTLSMDIYCCSVLCHNDSGVQCWTTCSGRATCADLTPRRRCQLLVHWHWHPLQLELNGVAREASCSASTATVALVWPATARAQGGMNLDMASRIRGNAKQLETVSRERSPPRTAWIMKIAPNLVVANTTQQIKIGLKLCMSVQGTKLEEDRVN